MRLRKQGQIDAKFTKRFVVAFGVVTYLVELAAADRDAPATATAPPPNAVRFRRRRPTSATPQLRQVPPPSASPCAPRCRCTGRAACPARSRGALVAARCLVLRPPPAVSALVLAGRRCSSPLPASLEPYCGCRAMAARRRPAAVNQPLTARITVTRENQDHETQTLFTVPPLAWRAACRAWI